MKKEWTEQDLRAFAENAQTAFEDVTRRVQPPLF